MEKVLFFFHYYLEKYFFDFKKKKKVYDKQKYSYRTKDVAYSASVTFSIFGFFVILLSIFSFIFHSYL